MSLTFAALQGHTLSSFEPVSRAAAHTVGLRGTHEAVIGTGLAAFPQSFEEPLGTGDVTLALEQVPGLPMHVYSQQRREEKKTYSY